ncbi:MAG: hypothetical protein AB1705_27440, partial [Verrucomicrobiota bacterium]
VPVATLPAAATSAASGRGGAVAGQMSSKAWSTSDFHNVGLFVGDADAPASFLIQFGGVDSKIAPELEEDLNVMSLLLQRKLEQTGGPSSPVYRMGIPLVVTPGNRPIQSLYLEGFGALFTLHTAIPLLPPEKQETKREEKPLPSDWENARDELYGYRRVTIDPAMNTMRLHAYKAPEYDAGQVDSLKKELLQALKNASNIRHLKTDDSVAVTVVGPGSGADSASTITTRQSVDGRTVEVYQQQNLLTKTSRPLDRTVLTVRAKKSDIDAFAKGSLSQPQFEKKAVFSTYRASGGSSPRPPSALIRSTR